MAKKIDTIIKKLRQEYPESTIRLNYSGAYQLLVATMLSAQCTDERVNIVTSELFRDYPTLYDIDKLSLEDLEQIIYSTGFYKAKAKHIKEATRSLIEQYSGAVPDSMEELTKLAGVGRKTANVVLGHCFGAQGVVVDTHVIRLSNRLGLVNTKNAVSIERKLMEITPRKHWVMLTHYLISHGRAVCKARKPQCDNCVLTQQCNFTK